MLKDFRLYLEVLTHWEVWVAIVVFFFGFLIVVYLGGVNSRSKILVGKLPEVESSSKKKNVKVTPKDEDITENAIEEE
ncbi:hypothetical protein WKV44_05205 [Spirochaetia bacterium 38H-sp]|uniref:CcoQ/FixQ family Cbb3-type cytochrome c oxidase assembly chaperone n=1 Tax=Rarispira pelagica TaxID=3141764 RepID=A0ABU9UB85_9SPIR